MNKNQVIKYLQMDRLKSLMIELYGQDMYPYQKKRYINLVERFVEKFDDGPIRIVSSPGRTELAGNHTDHNHGKVLAASIQLDSLAVVTPTEDGIVKIWSEGFPSQFTADVASLNQKPDNEEATSALIRGILAIFKSRGLKIGGFNALISSDVLIGSGLSSSASIEVLFGKILSVLYNNDAVNSIDLALIGQRAENDYLNKPCGLMDQVACSYGGIAAIDFANPDQPDIQSIHYSFEEEGYKLLVIDTGGDHADLTDDYAAIPKEMKEIASAMGKLVCRNVDEVNFLKNIPELTEQFGDRAVLRVLHFFEENKRVDAMVRDLKKNNIESYLEGVRASGESSYKFLQNVFTSRSVTTQKIALAIALTETYEKFEGAVRVHGGGFAGTVQVYIKKKLFEEFSQYMEYYFGIKSVTTLRIRQKGTLAIL